MRHRRTQWMAAAGLAIGCMVMGLGWTTAAFAQAAAGAGAPVVIMVHPADDPPYAWLDETGAARGAIVDMWRRWGAQEGLNVQFILADPAECRQRVISGHAAAHAGDIQDPALEKQLMYGDAILERSSALFVVTGSPIQSIDDLQIAIQTRQRRQQPPVQVGVLGGTPATDYMKLVYPDCSLTEFSNAAAMLESAARGGVDAIVIDTGVMAWEQNQGRHERQFRQVGGPGEFLFRHLVKPAVNLDNVRLLGRMNEGLRDLGGSAMLFEFMRAQPRPEPPPAPAGRYLWPAVLGLMGLVLMVLIAQVLRVKRQADQINKDLEALSDDHKSRLKELRVLSKVHKETEEQLKFLSTHDVQTMLPTRRVLDLVFPQLAAQMSRQGKMLAFLHVDMDDFRKINDTMGYATGDAALKLAADRLMALVRKSDVVVRLGGDELMVVLTNLDKRQQAGEVADKILHKLAEPGRFMGQTVQLHVSVGICFFPNDGKTLTELLQHADHAMCVVKASGKNAWKIWSRDAGPVERGDYDSEKSVITGAADEKWPVEEAVGVDDLFEEPDVEAEGAQPTDEETRAEGEAEREAEIGAGRGSDIAADHNAPADTGMTDRAIEAQSEEYEAPPELSESDDIPASDNLFEPEAAGVKPQIPKGAPENKPTTQPQTASAAPPQDHQTGGRKRHRHKKKK